MIIFFLIIIGKLLSSISFNLNLGYGSTWPGHIALNINKNFIKEIIKANPNLKIILIAGTNGKTTTGKLVQTILKKAKYRVFQNESGANLLNGIASTLIQHSNKVGRITYDFAVFEIDENTLPLALKEITPNYLIILNLFRDQLDRYGEVNTIANKWHKALQNLPSKTSLILNADDPQIAYLGTNTVYKQRHSGKRSPSRIPNGNERFWTSLSTMSSRPNVQNDGFATTVLYFGLNDKKLSINTHQHAVDSRYCPNCGSKLSYSSIFYSHLGIWKCSYCKNIRPKLDAENAPSFPLVGVYNRYNTIAAVLLSRQLRIAEKDINSALREFKPAFGRQEILDINGKKVQMFLSKNPTSFNEALRTIASMQAKTVLLVLNDRIPDGQDVSWIWDVDFEDYIGSFQNVFVSGDRAYDMGLRIKYASKFSILNPSTSSGQVFQFSMKNSNFKFQIEENLKKALAVSSELVPKSETLYVLPTYSAMLEVRKFLTGRKIL